MPIAAIPGETYGGEQERVDSRILPDVRAILDRFKVRVTDGYGLAPHSLTGQHPKGLALDIVPDDRRGGSWDDVDAAMKWAAESGKFGQVLYDGRLGTTAMINHGRGHHGHLGWQVDRYGQPQLVSSAGGGLDVGKVLDTATNAIPGVQGAKTLVGIGGDTAADVAGDAAKATAGALVGLVVDAIGRDGARVLLSVALVGVAVALIGFGAARALGLRTPPLPVPALAAARALKGA